MSFFGLLLALGSDGSISALGAAPGDLWGFLHRTAQPNQFLKFCKGGKKEKENEGTRQNQILLPRTSSTATKSSGELSRDRSGLGFGGTPLRGMNVGW